MEIRFEDHAGFHRSIARAVCGAAVAGALAPAGWLVQAAVAGSALAVALWPGRARGGVSRRWPAAALTVVACVASALEPRQVALLSLCALPFTLVLAAAREGGEAGSGTARTWLAVAAGAGAIAVAGMTLPAVAGSFAAYVPLAVASAAAAAAGALWFVLAGAPLYVAFQPDESSIPLT